MSQDGSKLLIIDRFQIVTIDCGYSQVSWAAWYLHHTVYHLKYALLMQLFMLEESTYLSTHPWINLLVEGSNRPEGPNFDVTYDDHHQR
jgi:hypothetical protein